MRGVQVIIGRLQLLVPYCKGGKPCAKTRRTSLACKMYFESLIKHLPVQDCGLAVTVCTFDACTQTGISTWTCMCRVSSIKDVNVRYMDDENILGPACHQSNA
jgi:hypothetical protein